MTKSVSEVGVKSQNNKTFMVTDFSDDLFCAPVSRSFIVLHYKWCTSYENNILHYFSMKVLRFLDFGNFV